MNNPIDTVRTDVLVIGSEGAGAKAALEAAQSGCEVMVITKGRLGRAGATQCAPGDYAINSSSARKLGMAGDPGDSWELHLEDMLEGGRGLNNVELASLLAQGAELGLSYLMEIGVPWTHLGKYPGHRFPRGAMVGEVGKTGTTLTRSLHHALRKKKITVLEDTFAIELLSDDGTATGCVALYIPSGELFAIQAKAVILATGGGSRIYTLTSGPEEATGDGMALAYKAGAELIDMEFVQFSPYTMIWPSGLRGHQSFVYEYFCVLGSWLMNRYGERFMAKWDSRRMEKSTRDLLSIGMMSEILAGNGSEHGGVYLSLSHLPRNLVDYFESKYFPGLQVGSFRLRDFGIEPHSAAFEVAPGAHFFMGGVKIDASCATTIPGLYAAGEVVGGVHGANRLSGNALTETQVFGAIAGRSAGSFAASRVVTIDPRQLALALEHVRSLQADTAGFSPFKVRAELQEMAWKKVGVIRNSAGLSEALGKLDEWQDQVLPCLRVTTRNERFNIELIKGLETHNMALVLRAIVISALERRKSCGAHYRSDSLDGAPDRVHYLVKRGSRGMEISSVDAVA